MRTAVENAALAVTSIVKIKKKAASFSEKGTQKEDIESSLEEEDGNHPLIMNMYILYYFENYTHYKYFPILSILF